jgi:signal transduction histidine kinase
MGRLSSRSTWSAARVAAIVVALVGWGLAAGAGQRAAMPGRDFLHLFAWATGTGLVGGLGMAIAVRVVRRRSMTVQIAVLTSGVAGVVSFGAWSGARAMFYSPHDLDVLTILLLSAATVGLATALIVGDRFARELNVVSAATRRLGEGDEGVPTSEAANPATTAEVAALVRELDETAQRLDQSRERERTVERSRRELVAWISHDLRTPLAGIRAVAEALEDGLASDDATRRRYYVALREESVRLGDLIDDLFELSRAQAGVLQHEFERLSLGDLVSDAIAGVAPVAASKGVRVVGRIERDSDVFGSAPELLRALRNIVDNAVRHTPSDGSVIVELGEVDGGVFVAVTDDGGGVEETALGRVFDPGFRADAARTSGSGAGLGLAIARSFVEAHRGAITVRNENRGARFTVWLPAHDAAAGSQ